MSTALSAGVVLHRILSSSPSMAGKVTKVFPVVTDKAVLPYISYRRVSLEHTAVKTGTPGADTAIVEVLCFAATYAGSVELAEAVIECLSYTQRTVSGVRLRSCTLVDSEETYEDEAYIQVLKFSIKV